MALRSALRISLPPLDRKRREHGEREIDQRQAPQSEPVMPALPDAGTQLVDANQSIDREVGGENPTERDGRSGDCLARPRETCGEELWQACCKEDERRVFRPREPGPDGLPHEAGRQQENRSQREELCEIAERRKAVDARQYDEIQRERWQVDCQVGYAAAEHTGE